MLVSFRLFFFTILITLVVPMLHFLLLFCKYFFCFPSNHKRFEVQCLGYPLANFQLLMISGLPCRCDNISVSIFVKNRL